MPSISLKLECSTSWCGTGDTIILEFDTEEEKQEYERRAEEITKRLLEKVRGKKSNGSNN